LKGRVGIVHPFRQWTGELQGYDLKTDRQWIGAPLRRNEETGETVFITSRPRGTANKFSDLNRNLKEQRLEKQGCIERIPDSGKWQRKKRKPSPLARTGITTGSRTENNNKGRKSKDRYEDLFPTGRTSYGVAHVHDGGFPKRLVKWTKTKTWQRRAIGAI